jgi:hypothetical protein
VNVVGMIFQAQRVTILLTVKIFTMLVKPLLFMTTIIEIGKTLKKVQSTNFLHTINIMRAEKLAVFLMS